MKLGTPIIGGAAAVALICFFMPWVTISCNKQPLATLSGWQIATGWTPAAAGQAGARPQAQSGDTILLFVLIASIACLVVMGLCLAKILAPKLAGIIATSIGVLALLLVIQRTMGNQATQSSQQGITIALEWQWGYFLTIMSYLGVIAGGVLNIILPDPIGGPAYPGLASPGYRPPIPPQPPPGFRPPGGPEPGTFGQPGAPPPGQPFVSPPGQAPPGQSFMPPTPGQVPTGQYVAPPPPGPNPPRRAFCTSCGQPMGAGARFCSSCGAQV